MNPAAGWYPDPVDPAQSRWWDGQTWTVRTEVHRPSAASSHCSLGRR
ncbi:DUF2510 domain-containing protein [Rhodococcus rhodochrous]|uniref:DUF2510 domain-containing protein n=1 Tax=Rhodococcus rhodochrous TaxID=1829 RepID=A0AA46WWI6_RHORH|nr:DUF2510 domain-containing protein [Rhodococcus rhodochrous]